MWEYLPARLAWRPLGAQRGRLYWLCVSGAVVYIPLVIRLIPNSETCWLPVDGQTGSADDRGVAGSIPGGGKIPKRAKKIPKRAATASVVVCHLFLLSVLFCCLFCLSVLSLSVLLSVLLLFAAYRRRRCRRCRRSSSSGRWVDDDDDDDDGVGNEINFRFCHYTV